VRENGIRILINSLKSLDVPEKTIIEQLVERYKLTAEKAEEYVK
jgi:hypothetical protein